MSIQEIKQLTIKEFDLNQITLSDMYKLYNNLNFDFILKNGTLKIVLKRNH